MFARYFFPLFLLLTTTLLAQRPAPTAPGPNPAFPIFSAKLPGGIYEVATRSMISVSSHEYLVDGAARVTEVNIDTVGSILVRFYFLEANVPNSPLALGTAALEKAQQMLSEGAERSGQDAWKKVMKSYPATTHARTVEYRLQSKDELTRILTAAQTAFRTQTAQSVSVE